MVDLNYIVNFPIHNIQEFKMNNLEILMTTNLIDLYSKIMGILNPILDSDLVWGIHFTITINLMLKIRVVTAVGMFYP